MNALERAVKVLGGQSRLADAIGGKVKQAHVWYWLNNGGGQAPAEYCAAIEAATAARGGVVTRYELRPDVFGAAPAHYQAVPAQQASQSNSGRRTQQGG